MTAQAAGFERARAVRTMLAIDTVARSVQAQHLQTSLDEAEWVDPAEDAHQAASRLGGFDFDQAPVGGPGWVLGFVLTAELAAAAAGGSARSVVHALDAEHLLSASASILAILEALRANGPIGFVVDGRDVTGFVVVPDLNKHPARTHFYLLLSTLEAALAIWVRDEYPDIETAVGLLGDEAKKVPSRQARDRRNNVEVDLVSGMDLGHLLTIAGSSAEGIARFGQPSFGSWPAWTEGLTSLRNAVMHPVLSFLGPKRTVVDLLAFEVGLRDVVARAAS